MQLHASADVGWQQPGPMGTLHVRPHAGAILCMYYTVIIKILFLETSSLCDDISSKSGAVVHSPTAFAASRIMVYMTTKYLK